MEGLLGPGFKLNLCIIKTNVIDADNTCLQNYPCYLFISTNTADFKQQMQTSPILMGRCAAGLEINISYLLPVQIYLF